MNKQAYFKMMCLDKKALKNQLEAPNFYYTGIPETQIQKERFLEQSAKKNPLPLLAQKQIADKLTKQYRNKATMKYQLKKLFSGKGLDQIREQYTGVPFLDDIGNWWRFLTRGK